MYWSYITQVGVAFLNICSLVTLACYGCYSNTCVCAFRLPLPAKQLIKRGKSLLPRFIFLPICSLMALFLSLPNISTTTQYLYKTSCRNICMHICYAHTKIQLNPISNFSDICKRNFQNPRDSKTHPRVSGMGKKQKMPWLGLCGARVCARTRDAACLPVGHRRACRVQGHWLSAATDCSSQTCTLHRASLLDPLLSPPYWNNTDSVPS